ncbi:chorismate mutase [Hyphococcus sp.]|uniref:chorismate mutase n=1 Tax=Hyphococcus sp. TaxID=2038636 RepID=UPI003CCC12DF
MLQRRAFFVCAFTPYVRRMEFPDATTPAERCQTMDEVRVEVDRLDRALVRLLTDRQSYMEAAARIKPARDEVRLPWRIEEVVSKVLAEAAKTGLSKRIAEPVWRELIERCIEHEHEFWAREHPGAQEK